MLPRLHTMVHWMHWENITLSSGPEVYNEKIIKFCCFFCNIMDLLNPLRNLFMAILFFSPNLRISFMAYFIWYQARILQYVKNFSWLWKFVNIFSRMTSYLSSLSCSKTNISSRDTAEVFCGSWDFLIWCSHVWALKIGHVVR